MDERGFTVVELLVAMTVLVGVMLATFSVLDDSVRFARSDTERASAIREAQVGIDRMVRELRHTRLVHAAAQQVLDVTVVRRGVDQRVVFDCGVNVPGSGGLRRCTRTPAGGPTTTLVDRVRNVGSDSKAFDYTPATGTVRHVTVRLAVAVDGGRKGGQRRSFILTDGTALRNVP
jgi:prepilin-type N-terminal cleavage/methylation domain-containing protein